MLDQFLEVAYEATKKTAARQEMVDAFMHFPAEELRKIASGRVKLAYHGDGDWLEKFKGSSLYDKALALEEQSLQIDIEDQQKRLARKAERETEESTWDAKDAICLKKRMLDLELVKSQGGEAQAPAKPMDTPSMNLGESDLAPGPDKISSVNIFYGQRQVALEKTAAVMRMCKTAAELQVSQPRAEEHLSADEKAKVLAAITKKFPSLATAESKLGSAEVMKVGSLQFRLGVPFGELTDLEKIAFLGAIGGGLKGAYNVFKSGLKGGVSKGALKAGYKATEAPGVMAGLKNVGHYGANWAKTNPGAAVGLAGGAALGTGLVAGHALSGGGNKQ